MAIIAKTLDTEGAAAAKTEAARIAYAASSTRQNSTRLSRLILAFCVLPVLTACAPDVGRIINEVNRESQAQGAKRANALLAQHLELIEKLRAEGDPLGDYLWARANADGWVPNAERDPLKLKQMYELAAERGSVDARHVLGMIEIDGSLARSGCIQDCPVLTPDQRNWRRGLARIEEAVNKQCWHWVVVISGGGSNGQYCLSPYITARYVWPDFRDGFVFQKNPGLEAVWKGKQEACRQILANMPIHFYFNEKFPVCKTAQ